LVLDTRSSLPFPHFSFFPFLLLLNNSFITPIPFDNHLALCRSFTDLKLVLDGRTYENLEGRWRDLFARVKWDVVKSTVKSVAGLQGRKFKELLPALGGGGGSVSGAGGGGGPSTSSSAGMLASVSASAPAGTEEDGSSGTGKPRGGRGLLASLGLGMAKGKKEGAREDEVSGGRHSIAARSFFLSFFHVV
jgi:hypothetical protein